MHRRSLHQLQDELIKKKIPVYPPVFTSLENFTFGNKKNKKKIKMLKKRKQNKKNSLSDFTTSSYNALYKISSFF